VTRSIVDVARAELGVREATGQNDGVPSERYMGGRREAWCAHFVAWVCREAGAPLPSDRPAHAGTGGENPIASVAFLERAMRRAGRWHPRSTEPRPGDLVFFSSRAGSDQGPGRHVEIVIAVTPTTIRTIGGNVSNAVVERTHLRNDRRITGYGAQAGGTDG
jgi:hypothetical protein